MNSSCINYRTVVNDAVCHPWEPMPEIVPATLTALIKYLREDCGYNPEALQVDAWRGYGFAVRMGYHRQFWIPGEPTIEEMSLLGGWNKTPENIPCPICGEMLSFRNQPGFGCMGIEDITFAACEKCNLKFLPLNGESLNPMQLTKILTR